MPGRKKEELKMQSFVKRFTNPIQLQEGRFFCNKEE